jgi:hypothetical protein
MQTNMSIANKKLEEKITRWKALQEDEDRSIAFEERRVQVEEKKATTELIDKENRIMMLNPNAMDDFTWEWWELIRMEISQPQRQRPPKLHYIGSVYCYKTRLSIQRTRRNHNTEIQYFNLENPLQQREVKPRAPASKTSLYRECLQTPWVILSCD